MSDMTFEEYEKFLNTREARKLKYVIKRFDVTPLTYAAMFGFERSAKALCSAGAIRDLKDPDGLNAIERGDAEDWIVSLIRNEQKN